MEFLQLQANGTKMASCSQYVGLFGHLVNAYVQGLFSSRGRTRACSTAKNVQQDDYSAESI
jgi:hypothetical protein